MANIDRRLNTQPELEAELLSVIFSIYLELGEFEKVETAARDGLRLKQAHFGQIYSGVAASYVDVVGVLTRQCVGAVESLLKAMYPV